MIDGLSLALAVLSGLFLLVFARFRRAGPARLRAIPGLGRLYRPATPDAASPAAAVTATGTRASPSPDSTRPGGGEVGVASGNGGAGDASTNSGAGGGSAMPLEMAVRPRVYVQPRIPEDVVRKRRVDDFVLLQVLGDTVGAVRDVRVLRAIPDCPECTESAVETAHRCRYEPVMRNGDPIEVWTAPFSLRFSYRR